MYSTRSAGQVFVLCLLAFFIDQVVSRPDGAPIGACADMVPQHFSSPQSSVSPFTTKAEKVSRIKYFEVASTRQKINFVVLRNRMKSGRTGPWT